MVRRRLLELLCIILLVTGLMVLFYPQIHRFYVDRRTQNVVNEYMESYTTEPTVSEIAETIAIATEFVPQNDEKLWYSMEEYNKTIWNQKQVGLNDTWTYESPSFHLQDYGRSDEVFGILRIPALELEMPIYLGATWQHMADGVAQLSQTSIPVGGINTNSVIAGHRGWKGATYFKHLPDLKPGDQVEIVNPWMTLQYQVRESKIIEPYDVKRIHIQENRDMITLLTCHPYASGGRQRYLVYCDRVK